MTTAAGAKDEPAPSARARLITFALLIALVLLTIFIAEWIGIRPLAVTSKVTIVLLPLAFAVAITMLLAVPLWRRGILKRVYSASNIKFASTFLGIIMLPLMVRYGSDIAPRLGEIFSIGWVFVLQELGALGTILLGLPVALMLGLRRQAIGSTLSLGREGELAYISEKYTLDSDPGRGVLSLYLLGTLFGALFFSFFAPLLLGFGFDVRALAIASGMGSASMMTAASASLVAQVPDQEEMIVSYAAAGQLLSAFLGMYILIFLAAPLQRFLYNLMMRGKDYLPVPKSATDTEGKKPVAGELFSSRRYGKFAAVLGMSIALILFTQQLKVLFNPEADPTSWLFMGGLAAMWVLSMTGIAVADLLKLTRVPVLGQFPVLGWVALVALLGCILWPAMGQAISSVGLLTLTTAILAFAGVSVADRLLDLSKTSWKVAITAVFVFMGIYVGSSLIAQLGLDVAGN